jgi:4-hydroxy-tetrahydrodipicolinate reductase
MKIGILGAKGRMGKMICHEIRSGQYGATVGAEVDIGGDAAAAFGSCDVMIDFTSPEACIDHAALASQYQKPLVVGTTGLSPVEEAALAAAAKKTAVFYTANMSFGVNLLLSLVEQAAAKLNDEFDIEIFEAHHRNKVDAPSGTALALGHAAAKGRKVKFEDAVIPSRFGNIGARVPGSIGMSVFRGGDVVGEHTVTFAGIGERIELTHKASDRAIFAKGAVKAALWLKGKKPGLYSMRDVLGV